MSLSAVLEQLPPVDAAVLERKAHSQPRCAGRTRCPGCLARSVQITLGISEPGLLVDACATCALVWLDRGEWAQLSRLEVGPLSEEERRRVEARWRLELVRLRAELVSVEDAPESAPAVVVGMLGFPIPVGLPEGPPGLVSVSLLASMLLFTVWSQFEPLLSSVLGFLPAQPFRLGKCRNV